MSHSHLGMVLELPTRISRQRYTYYVDSVNGSDDNDGSSEARAFATIGALPELTAGQSVGLARGSHWREQLTISANNVRIAAYGEGDKPLIDGSDIVTSWTKTEGQTNVYEATLSLAIDSATSWVNVWEDDTFLTRASSIANCDATPGSYYPSKDAGTPPVVVYIHPSDSGDPTSNGSVYEVASRILAISARSASNVTITGVRARRGLGNDGAASFGQFTTLMDCRFEDGTKHNVLVEGGSILTDVIAENAYYNSQSLTLFVLYEADADENDVTFIRCQALNTIAEPTVAGFYSHNSGGGSGKFGTVTLTDCVATNCSNAYDMSAANTVIFDNCLADTAVGGFACNQAGATYILRNGCQYKSAGSGQLRAINVSTLGTGTLVQADEFLACFSATPNGGMIVLEGLNCELELTNSILKAPTSAGIYNATNAAHITSNNNIFDVLFWLYRLEVATSTLVSDNNQISPATADCRVGGNTYSDIAAYKIGTGQDANSLVGTVDASAACA